MILPAHLWGRHDVTMTLAAAPRVLRGDFCCCRNRAAWSCESSSRIALMLERYDCVPDFWTSASLGGFLSHVSSRNRDIGTPRRTEDKTSKTDGGGETLHFPGRKILGKTRSRPPAGLSLGIRNTITFGADAGRVVVSSICIIIMHTISCCMFVVERLRRMQPVRRLANRGLYHHSSQQFQLSCSDSTSHHSRAT
jgi:hypothetical protein